MANETNTNSRAAAEWRAWIREKLKSYDGKFESIEKKLNDLTIKGIEEVNKLTLAMVKLEAKTKAQPQVADPSPQPSKIATALLASLGGAISFLLLVGIKYLMAE